MNTDQVTHANPASEIDPVDHFERFRTTVLERNERFARDKEIKRRTERAWIEGFYFGCLLIAVILVGAAVLGWFAAS